MNSRIPYNVLSTHLVPTEARIVVDADSPEHAAELVTKLLNNYKEVKIIDVYPANPDFLPVATPDKGQLN
jgi:hypothetical protein